MRIGIPKEIHPGENRVAATPDTVKKLIKLGFQLTVEAGAGARADYSDEAYAAAGAKIAPDARTLYGDAELVMKVQPPENNAEIGAHEADLIREHAHVVSLVWPARNQDLLRRLGERHVTVLALDCVPRISRAQKMDVLSSMANLAGYRAIIEAASRFGRLFTGQVTAAGKVPPAKVLVIGAGVAGLAAIGTAKGLGAIVRAFDTRPEVKDQVQSMGADFLELDFQESGTGEGGYAKVMSEAFIKAEMELFAKEAKEVDIIVTTALIPGKKAPTLITAEMVRSMRQGSVIVDMAAEAGGNCELTVPGEVVRREGVTIIGYTDLPSRLAGQSSQLYGNNLVNLLSDMCKGGSYKVDKEDEIVRGALVLDAGTLSWPAPRPTLTTAAKVLAVVTPPSDKVAPLAKAHAKAAGHAHGAMEPMSAKKAFGVLAGLGAMLWGLGLVAPPEFTSHLTVFVLACFIGWQVVWNVTPALHTPLMSVTNAISGIIVLGAILQVGAGAGETSSLSLYLAVAAAALAAINVAGGFLVTQRMLSMFRK